MKIVLGADHAGYPLKERVKAHLTEQGREVLDLGTYSTESVDYPDYAAAVGKAVVANPGDLGILICGTGIGISIAANKIKGVRAALCTDYAMAKLAREHNDANILALGGRTTAEAAALDIVDAFLRTAFAGGRHQMRLDKIRNLEAE
ncbi:MAG: ribose 5-phosphate isomerase B [Fusobacteriaceae bacterium]|jgi:ribose 5-phosphate isomerase B|nr:ribose 5-phosphate isomerase B [Fusobacteriaceae bacterium]